MCFILILEKREINLKKEKKKREENFRKDIIFVFVLIL